jgi:hypothetical protein
MKSLSKLSALALSLVLAAASAFAGQDSVLETYVLGAGQNSDGTSVAVSDKYFGNGTARARLSFYDTSSSYDPYATSGTLILNVSRYVPSGTFTLALFCDQVEVRGYDANGYLVYSVDLDGFTFGDSRGGSYIRTLRRIPANVADLEVTFLGNYE